jgi:hypothetical protein
MDMTLLNILGTSRMENDDSDEVELAALVFEQGKGEIRGPGGTGRIIIIP